MNRFENKVPPPLLLAAAAVLMFLIDRADVDGSPLAGTVSAWIGAVVAAIGLVVAIAGVSRFGAAGTTVDPHRIDQASALVEDGIYRFTRNPMYLGLTLIGIGWGLQLGSAVGLVVGTGLLVMVLTRLQIVPEERALEQRFGAHYRDYRSRVRRWI